MWSKYNISECLSVTKPFLVNKYSSCLWILGVEFHFLAPFFHFLNVTVMNFSNLLSFLVEQIVTDDIDIDVSGYRCMSDCRSRGREFDPGPVPYFRGD